MLSSLVQDRIAESKDLNLGRLVTNAYILIFMFIFIFIYKIIC